MWFRRIQGKGKKEITNMWLRRIQGKRKKEDSNMWFRRIQGKRKKEDTNMWFTRIQGEEGYTPCGLDGYKIKEREYKYVVKNETCPKHKT